MSNNHGGWGGSGCRGRGGREKELKGNGPREWERKGSWYETQGQVVAGPPKADASGNLAPGPQVHGNSHQAEGHVSLSSFHYTEPADGTQHYYCNY